MPVKKYILKGGGYCVQNIGEQGEIWEIRTKDENIRTRHAFYASQGKYNELVRYYREQLKKTKSQLTEPWVWDIIEDARLEDLRIPL